MLVVRMRLIPREHVGAVTELSRKYPFEHGPPFHVGHSGKTGISDLSGPDWGDPKKVHGDEITALWASGVTAQVALGSARLPIAITHRPGAMLITDIPKQEVRLNER